MIPLLRNVFGEDDFYFDDIGGEVKLQGRPGPSSRAGNNGREAVRVDEFAFAYEQCRSGKYLCNALRSQVKLCKARTATRLRPLWFSCEIWSTGSGSLKSSMLCTDKTEKCSASATWRVIVMQRGVNKVSRLSCESVLALLLNSIYQASCAACILSTLESSS